jgi:hypothetical protein
MFRSTLGVLFAFVGSSVVIVACGSDDADESPSNTGGSGNVSYYGGYGGSDGGFGGSDGGSGGRSSGGSGGLAGSSNGGAAGSTQGGAAGGGGLSPIDGTCENHCGQPEPPAGAKCYCDEDCIPFGDCCSDFDQLCSTGSGGNGGSGGTGGAPSGGGGTSGGLPSCVGHCGEKTAVPGSSPACYCDDACIDNSDCCFDFNVACAFVGGGGSGGSSSGPTCAGHCDKIAPAPGSNPPCYCDITCSTLNDCCADYATYCD